MQISIQVLLTWPTTDQEKAFEFIHDLLKAGIIHTGNEDRCEIIEEPENGRINIRESRT